MLQVPYTSHLFDEDGQFVAICPELNVSSYGDTPEQALTALQTVVTLFLEECQAMNTLETVLEEAGYYFDTITGRWTPRQPIQINTFYHRGHREYTKDTEKTL